MTYDWKDGYVVLFGGGNNGIGTPSVERSDTWTFEGGDWTNVTIPSDSPPGLIYPSCTYDAAPGDGYVLLFGGATGAGPGTTGSSGPTVHSSNQTWKFSGGRWTNLTGDSPFRPSARFGASMAFDSADGYVVLYGGASNGTSTANGACSPAECPHMDDTWTFHAGVWTNITAQASAAGTPPGRWEAGMTNDTADGYDVIFGGQANGYKSFNATGNYTWAFDAGRWANITARSSSPPGTRFGAATAYDPETSTAVLFSGLSNTVSGPLRDDTWSFDQNTWECDLYAANFTETGLPSPTNWTVTLTPSSGSPETGNSSTRTILFIEPGGAYRYSIGPIPGYHISKGSYSGSVTVYRPIVDVTWTQETYPVVFAEKGLPASTQWCVDLASGPTQCSSTTRVSFSEPNGTYLYSIASIPGYHLTSGNYSGSLTVDGVGPKTVRLPWAQTTYTVRFAEKGLPNGTKWSVTIDGRTKSTDKPSLTFNLPNGSFAFTVASTGYTESSTPSSPLSVTAATLTVKVTFS